MNDQSFNIPYISLNLRPAYNLYYDWTGWPTAGTTLPDGVVAAAAETAPLWAQDGLRLTKPHATRDKVQLLFSVNPKVSPTFCCMRAKGRLQHALRKRGMPVDFSRKVGFRCLGENTTAIVEEYIRKQVSKEELADARYARILDQMTVIRKEVDLARPSESSSGRYWYNHHVVLVIADRFRITRPDVLARIREVAMNTAEEGEHRVAAVAVLPDHTHMAIRGCIENSPEEIALKFQNGLARAVGCRAWQDGFYVGTFSEYGLAVIRGLWAGNRGL
jgi:REP element-mobilizing transposase RayT